MAIAEQQARLEVDAWEEKVSKWLAGRNDVSVGEVLVGGLGSPPENWSQSAQNRVATILKSNGFKQYRPGKTGNREPRVTAKRPSIIRAISLKDTPRTIAATILPCAVA